VLSSDAEDKLFSLTFEHLAIVGKEPLVNDVSIRRCESLIARCLTRGISVSMITNGVRLSSLSTATVGQLAWLDVSLDGGSRSYGSYRKYSYGSLLQSLKMIHSSGFRHINALHVLNDQTLPQLDDILSSCSDFPFETAMFSPYIDTRNHGHNAVKGVPLLPLLNRLAETQAFMDNPAALLLLETFHLDADGLSSSLCKSVVQERGLTNKVVLLEDDPLSYGILRLTYDDLLLTPQASLHPAEYILQKISPAPSLINAVNQIFSPAQ